MCNYFTELNSIDVSERVEKKGKLSYLSWAWAWAELKKRHPDATSTVYENNGLNYFHDGKTAWVKVGVTVNGVEHIEYLPVMDNYHNSIPLEKITSFQVNTAIQRGITKAIARHGLGLYIYAGEDLPDTGEAKAENKPRTMEELLRQKLVDVICHGDRDMSSIKPEQLASAIKEELTLYSEEVTERIRGLSQQAAKDLVKKTRKTAPVGARGDFRRRISMVETTRNKRNPSFTWYVKAPDHRLTHLLVKGHATRDGGRTRADPFLQNAMNEVLPDYERKVEEAIKND